MKNKLDETAEIKPMEEIAEILTPFPIATNFGRDDLNELRDIVNFLLSRLK